MTTPRRDGGVAAAVEGLKRTKGKKRADAIDTPTQRRPGRPRGKKSDPEYRQHSVWLRNTTHLAALSKLREVDPYGADFSVLVEELVSEWTARTAKRR